MANASAAAPVPEGPMSFRARPTYLTMPELEQFMRLCPSAEAYRAGFYLQDADVDELLRVAKEIEGAQVYADPAYPQEQTIDLLLRTVRLLQVGLDIQFKENEQVINDYNTMREDFQEVEDRERRAQTELDRLRELRDKEQADGDVTELRRKNDDIARRLDDEYRSNDRMRQQRERDERRIEDLEYRLQRADDDLRERDDRMKEVEDQFNRLQEDYTDLRQTYESLRAEHTATEARLQLGDAMRQQEWKIERLTKENRALELQNTELRKQTQDVKTENIEVSEKIVLLDDEARKLKAREADFESRMEQLVADKAALLTTQEELRAEVTEKMTLLDEFEARFQRQYKSWEEERASLQAQIEALKRGDGRSTGGARRRRTTADDANGEDDEELQDLRDQLNEALEKEILLLEAYEQLELSVATEIDRALGKQAEELKAATRRVDFLNQRLDEERGNTRQLREHQEYLEDQVKDAVMRNRQYEGGVYGLPQAVEEIHQMKEAVYKEQGRVRELCQQINKLSAKVEDLHDENTVLRQKAGLGEGDRVDIKDVRMQKEAAITQLRSLNALLERQVADLEEERRKLRMEMKFRAKYHGQHALEMGLTPEQLLLVEQYVDDIKGHRSDEARLVEQLQRRIEFLEVRLSEVMAYADIPPSMRPALSEFDPVAALTGTGAADFAALTGGRVGSGLLGTGNVRAAQVEAIKAALLKSLGMLREMNQSLLEKRNVSDKDYQKWTETVITQLTDAERAVDAVLKELMAAVPGTPGSNLGHAGSAKPGVPASPGGKSVRTATGALPPIEGDAGFLADAMADELRERLRQLARQVAELQGNVIQKEATIQLLSQQKAELEAKFGKPLKDRKADFVPRADYDDLNLECASLKEQLLQGLEELAAREREVAELSDATNRYQLKMQTFADQVKMVYRDYAAALNAWKTEKHTMERRIKKLHEDADGYKAASAEYQRGLDTLSKSPHLTDLQKELMDTVRRIAIVQIKHAKVARELEASNLNEHALQERVEELEQEVRDVSSTCRSRMRWLEQAADAAKRRVEMLFRELQSSVPLAAYQMLSEKHARQQGELRRLVEEAADHVLDADEVFRLRDELASLMAKYDAAADTIAESKEKNRQLEMTRTKEDRSLDMKLAQELVAARVSLEAALRRAEMMEAERNRIQRTLTETQTRLREVEERLAQSASELELVRGSRGEMERRLMGAKPKDEVDELMRRLDVAEKLAAEKHNDYSNLCYRAEESDRKLEQAVRDRQRHLAELTNLRAALRDAIGRSEQAAVVGKLHEQLDHVLSKESLARNALNRSELQRIELEKELRKMKTELSTTNGRAMAHQDQARWADKQRQEAQAQLDVSLAGRTEMWKAKLWARKLEQLKVRNDAIADGLDLARRRIKKLEDARQEAELKVETSEDVSVLLTRGVSEVVRDAARLHEQLMQLKLERGKLSREEVLLREKVHYVERVNAELHELIEKYEAEFFSQQVALEGDKASALAQARVLQDELMRLQERLANLMASKDTDSMDQARKSLTGGLRVSQDVGARLKAHMAAASAGDRQMMLKQIESLKAARQEAEHLRQETHRMQNELAAQGAELSDVRRHHNDALARLQQQSEALLFALNYQKNKGAADETAVDQMKAVAEATINELKSRMKDRDKAMEDLKELMSVEKGRWVAQHQTDRAEIERLNQRLFERNDASIDNLKEVLSRVPRNGGEGATNPAELAHLRDTMQRTNDDLAVLRNQLEQRDAALEVLRRNHEAQMRALELENERLRGQIHEAKREEGPSRALLAKLQGQLRAKDDKLRQLRDAFKTLEGKLVEAHKRIADEAMKQSSWKEQEVLEERVAALEAEKAKLQAALQLARDDADAARVGGNAGAEAALASLREQLQAARDRASVLDAELARTRAALQKFKNAERTVMDLTTGMSVEAKRQIDDLQKRVNVLEKQNASLKRTLQNEDATGALGGGGYGGDDDDGGAGPSGRGPRPPSRGAPSTNRRSASGPDATGASTQATATGSTQPGAATGTTKLEDPAAAAARTASAIAAWDENKKLNKRIDELRKKLAAKADEVQAVKSEADKKGAQVMALQSELDKQAAVIRDMQEKLRKAQAAPKLSADTTKLREYVERLDKADAECDALRTQLAKVAGQPSTSSAPTDPLKTDSELFELRLQRDQARMQAQRLKDRLADLFGPEASDLNVPLPPGTSGRLVTARSSGGGAAKGTMGAREAELLSTINNLKTALEKATASSTPTTKYMAEVQKRKEAQRDAEAAKLDNEKMRTQLATMQRMVGEMQAANAEARKQLKLTQEAAASGAGSSAAAAAAVAQVANLETLLSQREAEVRALRSALAERDAALSAAAAAGDSTLQSEVAGLREQLAEVEAENKDLKAELNAFDPRFFEEIEDLKHDHHVLSGKVGEYERIISQLSMQLGRPPPVGLGSR